MDANILIIDEMKRQSKRRFILKETIYSTNTLYLSGELLIRIYLFRLVCYFILKQYSTACYPHNPLQITNSLLLNALKKLFTKV